MKRLAKKLSLSRTTLRALSARGLGGAHAAMQDLPTRTCYCAIITVYTCSCKDSVCNSCYDTDCCLIKP